jgi:hypothetical protein
MTSSECMPVLPVLCWDASQFTFGAMYPGSGDGPGDPVLYLADHAHRHADCGHVTECVFPWLGEPCQACEVHAKFCPDCEMARYRAHEATCPGWNPRTAAGPAWGHQAGCPYLERS